MVIYSPLEQFEIYNIFFFNASISAELLEIQNNEYFDDQGANLISDLYFFLEQVNIMAVIQEKEEIQFDLNNFFNYNDGTKSMTTELDCFNIIEFLDISEKIDCFILSELFSLIFMVFNSPIVSDVSIFYNGFCNFNFTERDLLFILSFVDNIAFTYNFFVEDFFFFELLEWYFMTEREIFIENVLLVNITEELLNTEILDVINFLYFYFEHDKNLDFFFQTKDFDFSSVTLTTFFKNMSITVSPFFLEFSENSFLVKIFFFKLINFFINIIFFGLYYIPVLYFFNNSFITLMIIIILFFFIFITLNFQLLLLFKNWQLSSYYYYLFFKNVIADLITHKKGHQYYFHLISWLFVTLCCLNIFGLIPNTFVLTSQFSFTFYNSFLYFLSLNFTGITLHGFALLSLFFPSGAPLFIAPLLVLIEVISYFARVFSLAIRLFANITAGHILLKILSSFTYAMITLIFAFLVSCFIITVLWVLEFFISILQAYVFTILICIYLTDVLNLH
jgi:F-type H+-transporting ATPase subunit a